MAAHGILLAVAVHDKGAARLERAVTDSLEVEAGKAVPFRVSYALHDAALGRQDATVSALVTMPGQKPIIAEQKMRDRPIVDDTRRGDLVFEIPGLRPGKHTLHFVVALETSDAKALGGAQQLQRTDLHGDVEIDAVAPT